MVWNAAKVPPGLSFHGHANRSSKDGPGRILPRPVLCNSTAHGAAQTGKDLSGETERNAKTVRCVRRKEFQKVFAPLC